MEELKKSCPFCKREFVSSNLNALKQHASCHEKFCKRNPKHLEKIKNKMAKKKGKNLR